MLLFTKPIARPAIWGGTLLREYFRYPDFPDGIGQSWSFSAQEGADQSNVLVGGPYDGKTLLEVWQEAPELFRSRWERFPVIISLVAPVDDLSLQIHPRLRLPHRRAIPQARTRHGISWKRRRARPSSTVSRRKTRPSFGRRSRRINGRTLLNICRCIRATSCICPQALSMR